LEAIQEEAMTWQRRRRLGRQQRKRLSGARRSAKLVPPEWKWLSAIILEGDAEAVVKEKKEKALAEHVARHPEDVGRTVEDFKWILRVIVRPAAPG
jgi:hypothetical protein